MFIADLHLHSKYSRATSRDCDLRHLDLWARNKGISLLGTGDFTHPQWRAEMEEFLVPAEEGLYVLKEELRLPALVSGSPAPRFVLSGEISTIYKKDGRTRKVHHVILLPSLEDAGRLARRLEDIGNLHSDGRPILGLDSCDLLSITLDTCPRAILIPAHIWTPHFSMLGAFSGFDSLQECYGDLSCHIHAVETGLSSDPPMNRSVSALDGLLLVSNSDAHSPSKLGREANLLSCPLSYSGLAHALETGEGFEGTLEFFPEEGKYHLDGHRSCQVCLEPRESLLLENRCPRCGKKLTIGVQHRVFDLADRSEEETAACTRPFERLIPLQEVLGNALGRSPDGKPVLQLYEKMLRVLGSEFHILRHVPQEDIAACAGFGAAEAIRRMRAGEVRRIPGYDGEYGVIRLLEKEELARLSGQMSLLSPAEAPAKKQEVVPVFKTEPLPSPQGTLPAADFSNPAQEEAVSSCAPVTAVIAGPGSGKTKTLVDRIVYLIEILHAPAETISAITFTRQAAQEMRQRLQSRLGNEIASRLTIGTFHAVCLSLLPPLPLIDGDMAEDLMNAVLKETASSLSCKEALEKVSRIKNGESPEDAGLEKEVFQRYRQLLSSHGVRDLDDLLLDALDESLPLPPCFTHLLVDEFQDVNPIQRRLVYHWSQKSESLFVIGDPDQSIYGFRGASALCFEELKEHAPSLKLLTLEKNYRSSPEILDSALSVICRNPGAPRVLRSVRPSSKPVRLVQAESSLSEAIWVAKEIARLNGGVDMLQAHQLSAAPEQTRSFSEIAVLCRTHRQLEQMESCLRREGIPCRISSRGHWLESPEVQGTLAFFRYLLDTQNLPALESCLRRLWHLSGQAASEISSALRQGIPLSETPCPAEFLEDALLFASRIHSASPSELLSSFLSRREKNQATELLSDAAFSYDTLENFVSACLSGSDSDVMRQTLSNASEGAVRLMTLHACKGLEFPVVFLCGVSQDQLPLCRKGVPSDIEEERRLFFVGMTRAREELIISSGGEPSPFLQELPQQIKNHPERLKSRPPRVEQLTLFSF